MCVFPHDRKCCIFSVSINLNKALRTRQLLIDFDAGRPVVSLRAPLELINFQSIACPRWPVECEVISDAIHHIGKSTTSLSYKKKKKCIFEHEKTLCSRVGPIRTRTFLSAHWTGEDPHASWGGEGESGLLPGP